MAASAASKKVRMLHKHHGNDLLRRPSHEEIHIEDEEQLAPECDRIRQGDMEKKVLSTKGVLWQHRFAVLTVDRLSFTTPGDSEVIDHIPLHEINSVELQHEYADPALAADTDVAKANSRRSSSIRSSKSLKELQPPSHDEAIWEWHLVISTIDDGHNAGRSYILRVPAEEAESWRKDIKTRARESRSLVQERILRLNYGHSRVAMLRARMKIVYESSPFQYVVSVLIVISFVCDLSEAQV